MCQKNKKNLKKNFFFRKFLTKNAKKNSGSLKGAEKSLFVENAKKANKEIN